MGQLRVYFNEFNVLMENAVYLPLVSGLLQSYAQTFPQIKDNYKSSEGILIKCADDCDERVKNLTGKRILFARYSGDDIKIDGEEFVLATDSDIFGSLE